MGARARTYPVPHRHLVFGIPKTLRRTSATTAICSKTSAASPHECLIEFLRTSPSLA
jgi:hypothetical protein